VAFLRLLLVRILSNRLKRSITLALLKVNLLLVAVTSFLLTSPSPSSTLTPAHVLIPCIATHAATTKENNVWRDNDQEDDGDNDGSDAEEKEGISIERVQSPFLRTDLEGGMEGPGSNRGITPTARPYSNLDPFSPARQGVRDTRIKVQDPGTVTNTLTRTVSSLRTGTNSGSYSSVLSEMEGGIDLRAERTLDLDDSIPMSPTSVPRKLLNPSLKGADSGSYMPVRTSQGDEGEGEEGSDGLWKGMDTQCSYGSDSSSSYYSAYSPPSASPSVSTSASTSASKYTNSISLSNSNSMSKNTNTLSEVDQTSIHPTDPRISTPVSSGSSTSQTQHDSRFPASINSYSLQVQVTDRSKVKDKGKDRSKGKDSAGDNYVRQSHSPVPSSASSPYSPLLSPPSSANTASKMGERSSYGGV
jgi:hypothetical protein